MKNENVSNKENNWTTITLVIIVIMLAIAISCLLFLKRGNDNGNMQSVNNNEQVNDNSNYNVWMNYLLNQDIIEIRFIPLGDYPDSFKTVSINKLKEFFKDFNSHNYSMTKRYVMGKGTDNNIVSILYLKNGKKYEITIADANLVELFTGERDGVKYEADLDFVNAIETVTHNIEGAEYKNQGAFVIYYFNSSNNKINFSSYEKYFK